MKKINQGNSKKNPKKAAIAMTALAVFFPLLTGVIFFIFLSKTNQNENKKLALASSSAHPSLAKHEVVGDLGGISVRIPSHFAKYAEYEGDPGWSGKRIGPTPIRDTKSKLVSFGFDIRYPDMAGLSSPDLRKNKEAFSIFNTPWLRGIVTTGVNFGDGGFLQRMSESMGKMGSLQFEKQKEKQFGLEVYTPIGVDPQTRNPQKHIDDDKDLYIFRDENGVVQTYIECTNINHDAAPCKQFFFLLPRAKAKITLSYRRGLLSEWKQMQDSVGQLILGFESR
ncbi:hypothetical protein ACO0LN_03540 [Undibacterium sp. TC9W]